MADKAEQMYKARPGSTAKRSHLLLGEDLSSRYHTSWLSIEITPRLLEEVFENPAYWQVTDGGTAKAVWPTIFAPIEWVWQL